MVTLLLSCVTLMFALWRQRRKRTKREEEARAAEVRARQAEEARYAPYASEVKASGFLELVTSSRNPLALDPDALEKVSSDRLSAGHDHLKAGQIVAQLATDIFNAEERVCKYLDSNKLNALIETESRAGPGLKRFYQKRLEQIVSDKKGIVEKCGHLINNAEKSRDMYVSVFRMHCQDTMSDYRKAADALDLQIEGSKAVCRQQVTDLASLYAEAAKVRPSARRVMESLMKGSDAQDLEEATSGTSHVRLKDMPPLKRVSRACEKMVLKPRGKDGVEACDASKICDIVRDTFECDSMGHVAKMLERIANCKEMVVVRFKDRYTRPTDGGWRDAMINYRLNDPDPELNKHICEIQVCHSKMLVARVGLGGHDEYAVERSAREILEHLREDVPSKFAPSARVFHSSHGPGAVVEIMEDGRTKVRFDNGEEHRYKPSSMHKITAEDQVPEEALQQWKGANAERTEIKETDEATRGTTQKKDRPGRLTCRSSERESASSTDSLLSA